MDGSVNHNTKRESNEKGNGNLHHEEYNSKVDDEILNNARVDHDIAYQASNDKAAYRNRGEKVNRSMAWQAVALVFH